MRNSPNQQWFEMPELRKKRFSNSVWIPLRQSETIINEGDYFKLGFKEEVLCVGSVAIPLAHKELADKLGWSDIGLAHDPKPYAFKDGRYKPCDIYQYSDGEDFGVELVLVQRVNSNHQNLWHINQDLIMALGLIQEGNVWVRPDEAYVEVIKVKIDNEGYYKSIEIKAEFLRDYLAARSLILRLAIYRQRTAIVSDASYITWSESGLEVNEPHDRFEAKVSEADRDDGLFGGEVAVFSTWRTDVDPNEDVPVFGPETNSNTASRSFTYKRQGKKSFRVAGELWREEWIEPAAQSERVRGDDPDEPIFFTVDASAGRLPSTRLNFEEVGRYLWFSSQVINVLSEQRGGGLSWYTRDTGVVSCSPDYKVHFGINKIGLINVYAYDVASLPNWQQRIWASCNLSPDGAVSEELLSAQMATNPANTIAPEVAFSNLLKAVDERFTTWSGKPLFRVHEASDQILRKIHRFRAFDKPSLLVLAKDVARLTADLIDVSCLQNIITAPKGEKWGSLKHLEKALSTKTNPDKARDALTILVGIYELRLGDAHLPSSRIDEAFAKVGIDLTDTPLNQSTQLLENAAECLAEINNIAG